tara:strand:+ start:588 stop:1436 length:849 start_codon:yes stop_codon:yes gene_type:complete
MAKNKKTQIITGFNQGQYGDLFLQLTPAKLCKILYPDVRFIFSINKKYKEAIKVLSLSEDIDGFIVWDGYNDWPTQSDKEKIADLQAHSSQLTIFNPMQTHTVLDWYNYWHITEEACVMHGLPRPTPELMDFKLNRPNLEKENTVCISVCASGLVKSLRKEQIQVIKEFCDQKNLKLIQIGGPSDPPVEGVEKFNGDYSESVFKVLKSRFLVSADTGMVWAASAFSHYVLGIYCMDSELNAKGHKNWTPKNKNQQTIVAQSMGDIRKEVLEKHLEEVYTKSK